MRALIQRAQALEPRLGGAARADLEELLAALLAERYRVAQPGAADRLANLERALVQLEAGAPKQSASSLPIGPD